MTSSRAFAAGAGAAADPGVVAAAALPVGAPVDVVFLSLPHDAATIATTMAAATTLVHFRTPTCRRTAGSPCVNRGQCRTPFEPDRFFGPQSSEAQRVSWQNNPNIARVQWRSSKRGDRSTNHRYVALLETPEDTPPKAADTSPQSATCRTRARHRGIADRPGRARLGHHGNDRQSSRGLDRLAVRLLPESRIDLRCHRHQKPRQGHADRRGSARLQAGRRLARRCSVRWSTRCSSSTKSSRAFGSCGSHDSRAQR